MLLGRPKVVGPHHRGWLVLRVVACGLMLGWLVFCAVAIVGDVVTSTPKDATGQRAVMIALGWLLVAVPVALPWRWELAGGLLLLILGTVVAIAAFPASAASSTPTETLLISIFIIAGLPFVAGFVFVAHAWAVRSGRLTPP
jgi:hypothetical protein